MLSPTSAIMERSFSTFKGSTLPVSISWAKYVSIVFLARSAFLSSIPTHIECSDDPCVMSMTFIFSLARASNNRFEKPGIPIIPLPSRLNSTTELMLEMPLILLPFLTVALSMIVPSSFGENVFFIQTGICFFITG